jgi:hypothetical protein
VKLIAIAPRMVADFLPIAHRHIAAAVERAGMADLDPVLEKVRAGQSLLWVAVDDANHIRGAGITELIIEGAGLVCVIVAWGQDRGVDWSRCLQTIEKFARDEECKAVRLYGRPGWQRCLPEYRLKAVVMERPL